MFNFSIYLTLIILMPIFSALVSAQQPTLVINTTGQPPLNTTEQTGFMDQVCIEAFKRIGYRIKTVQLPAERGLRNTNSGVEDGEMSRIAGLQKIYPNLVQVSEKIMDWHFVVFSSQDINLNKSWDSLAGKNVSIINGWKILERNVPTSAHITKARTPQQLFALLEKDRVDYIIYERWAGLLHIKQRDRLNSQLKIRLPALAVREMFIYLHKKHAIIVPKLEAALKAMKTDGTYLALFNQILEPLEAY